MLDGDVAVDKAGADAGTGPVDTKHTARPAPVNHGFASVGADGQREMRRRGPQSRLMIRLQRVLFWKWFLLTAACKIFGYRCN